uniref:Exoribonuclease phosphorolytic domain-containing protein n=1 Tax=Pseudo-nitzschia australis TaxID=44445 RepID=A0A7S4EJT1_9STRA|mmetsp:Transcript_22696/g.49365  ORF Transcript_22696/g.49365 Transcript_22696/m.49365 type:complete len:252 (-) Transcript_22696:1575-2330(-)|eukprot:CAMPEP_0168190858 /NCGR_PEP_ID=MMETSP0139_2-20121125/17139_1 /TAXON_ID=44445 /ORGANISM="Pseudo-nitzschia australis, Strain 10249 10 AB" /LENGTH=251 /DNA_ID=CAMNT_0008113859 /DNA_START=273 /DNA_END=1028 /DNA_ORIENTATION=-
MANNKRTDGRASDTTLRPLACELSCLHRPDGSALWKSGSTHVLAAVYGPIAPQNMNNEGDVGRVSVVIKSGMTDNGTYEHEMGEFLTEILSSCIDVSVFPRCIIEVVLQIIMSDGSLLGCLLHGAVAALMDAGVDLLYLPVATTCLVGSVSTTDSATATATATATTSSKIRLDPTAVEEQEERDSSILVLVNEQKTPDRILGSHTVGTGVSLDELLSCVQIASKACSAIPTFWRLAMEQKLNRESQTLWSR